MMKYLAICVLVVGATACHEQREERPKIGPPTTLKSAIPEVNPGDICNILANSSAVVRGRVSRVEPTVEISPTARYSGGLFTPVTILVDEALLGSLPSPARAFVYGAASSAGRFEDGEIREGSAGYFFLAYTEGSYYLYPGGGFFALDGRGRAANVHAYRDGVGEQDLRARILAAAAGSACAQ